MMTLIFLFLLFLSVNTAPSQKVENKVVKEIYPSVSEILRRANSRMRLRLQHFDIMASKQRNADACTATGCLWRVDNKTNVFIPVALSDRYTLEQKNTIIRGLLTFHDTTCIRFVWRTSHTDYLQFFPGSGCWSYVGRQGDAQQISLSTRGCLHKGTIQHEVLHALGFHHEQTRSDRDDYVNILYDNIQRGYESNFEKENTNNLESDYDFDSVMQYENFAFSSNNLPTIEDKKDPKHIFGFATQMSQSDIYRINKLYNCTSYIKE